MDKFTLECEKCEAKLELRVGLTKGETIQLHKSSNDQSTFLLDQFLTTKERAVEFGASLSEHSKLCGGKLAYVNHAIYD